MVEPPQLEKCHRSLSGESDALGKGRGKTAEPLSKHSSNSSSGPVSSSSATQSSSSDVVSTGRGQGPAHCVVTGESQTFTLLLAVALTSTSSPHACTHVRDPARAPPRTWPHRAHGACPSSTQWVQKGAPFLLLP